MRRFLELVGGFVEVSDLDKQILVVRITPHFFQQRRRFRVGHLFHLIEGGHLPAHTACRGRRLGAGCGLRRYRRRLRSAKQVSDRQPNYEADYRHRVDLLRLPSGCARSRLDCFIRHSSFSPSISALVIY